MKKLSVIAIASVCLGILTGCATLSPDGLLGEMGDLSTPTAETPLSLVMEKYEKLPDAVTVVQHIEISQGDIVQYDSAKTFAKEGSVYTVTGTVKQLNSLASGAAEEYTVTSVQETRNAGEFSVRLNMNELYFSPAPTFENGVLEGRVKDDSVETVFAISENLPVSARPHGLKLRIETDETHVTGMNISYDSKNSTVNITLTFVY